MNPSKFVSGFCFLFFYISFMTGCIPNSDSCNNNMCKTETPRNRIDISPNATVTLQLTYVNDCGGGKQCIYAIEIDCLECEILHLSKPILLSEIQSTEEEPNPPIFSMSWSPDGLDIVIDAIGFGERSDVFKGDWNGKNWINLTNDPEIDGEPEWMPGGNQISFISKVGIDPYYYLQAFIIQPDGTGKKDLFDSENRLFRDIRNLSWSPNAEQVVFTRPDSQGYNQVFISSLDGSVTTQLTNIPQNHFNPRFSPDGQWIVFIRESSGDKNTSDLYLIRADGSDEKAITFDDRYWRASLSWSPIGDLIAFGVRNNGNYDIYLIHPDGTGLIQATNSNQDDTSPVFRMVYP